MTAAVPAPRFHDQLAQARRAPWVYNEANGWVYGPDPDHAGLRYPYVYAADPEQCRILVAKLNADAAEVEARVQAAANQREAETLLRLADAWDENASRWYHEHRHTHPNGIGWVGGFEEGWCEGARLLRARVALLASPAPAPRAEEGL